MVLAREHALSDYEPWATITRGADTGVTFLYLPGHANDGDITIGGLLPGLTERGTVVTMNYPRLGFDAARVVEAAVAGVRQAQAATLVFLPSSMGGLLVPSVVATIRRHNASRGAASGLPSDLRGVALCAMTETADTVFPVGRLARFCYPPLASRPLTNVVDLLGMVRDQLPIEEEVYLEREHNRRHRRSLRGLHHSARREQLEFMANATRRAPADPNPFPWVYLRARQVNGHFITDDGFVRGEAAHNWRSVYRETDIVDCPDLRHSTFVEQPQAWGEAIAAALDRIGITVPVA